MHFLDVELLNGVNIRLVAVKDLRIGTAVEAQARIGGEADWCASIARDRAGIGANDLHRGIDIRCGNERAWRVDYDKVADFAGVENVPVEGRFGAGLNDGWIGVK